MIIFIVLDTLKIQTILQALVSCLVIIKYSGVHFLGSGVGGASSHFILIFFILCAQTSSHPSSAICCILKSTSLEPEGKNQFPDKVSLESDIVRVENFQ